MSLTLTIVSRQSRALGARATMTFGQDGGTIGRSIQNDWALPDKQKYLSARHASIDFRSGSYYIVDTSKNGVFINGEHEPVGLGKPQRLFEGDCIRIGEYEMRAAIEDIEDTRDSLIASSHVDPVDLKQLVEAPDPTSCDLVDVHAMTGVSLEMALEEEIGAPQQTVTVTGDRPKLEPTAEPELEPEPESEPESAFAALPDATADAGNGALAAFFRGAGIEAPQLAGEAANTMLQQIGLITRELVAGLVDNMQLRAVQKAQIDPSMSSADDAGQGNFTMDAGHSLECLLSNTDGGSADAIKAVRAAFADLHAHQRALLSSNRRALHDYLTRLDPETIERSLTGGKRGSLLNAAHKFRYWDTYRDVFTILGNRPGDDWPEPYRLALAEAYAALTNPATEESGDIEVVEQRAAG